ncbi:MAG: ATP-binding cassette domain-containing protein [Hydrogenoanaerobacterium sp.]
MSDTLISLKELGKTFKSKNSTVVALQNISLDINKGEIFGIIGMSGAGKSTLVRCINFLEKPTSGSVIFDGKDLGTLSGAELGLVRQQMGMIFQQFNLLMQRTVVGNICFPMEVAKIPHAQALKRAAELLELVGLSDKAGSYPAQLSGGQKQRVAIARALATSPKVLLCDEATSALDPTTTRSILTLLKDINKRLGVTVVIITHEMAVIEEVCRRVAIISDSSIAEIGEVGEIFLNPRSEAAKRLVYPEGKPIQSFGSRCCRIVFDGSSSFEPVIANMIMECKEPVNILFADTKNIDGKAFGQIVVQLPLQKEIADKMLAYLRIKNLKVEEVEENV